MRQIVMSYRGFRRFRSRRLDAKPLGRFTAGDAADGRQGLELRGAGACAAVLPIVDRQPGNADQAAVVLGGKAKAAALRFHGARREPQAGQSPVVRPAVGTFGLLLFEQIDSPLLFAEHSRQPEDFMPVLHDGLPRRC